MFFSLKVVTIVLAVASIARCGEAVTKAVNKNEKRGILSSSIGSAHEGLSSIGGGYGGGLGGGHESFSSGIGKSIDITISSLQKKLMSMVNVIISSLSF